MDYAEYIKDRFVGQPVHIVASGPSMYGFDYRRFRGRIVLATNHAYRCLNVAGAECYAVFNDVHFVQREDRGRVLDTPGVRVLAAKQTQVEPRRGVTLYDFVQSYSGNPSDGVYGREVAGATALCIALQGGARRVYLWGVDSRSLDAKEMRRAAELNGANSRDRERLEKMLAERATVLHATDGVFNHSVTEEKYGHLYTDKVRVFDPFPTDRVFNMSLFSAVSRFTTRLPEEVLPW